MLTARCVAMISSLGAMVLGTGTAYGQEYPVKPIRKIGNLSPCATYGDGIYFAQKNSVFTVDLTTGMTREIAKLHFEGDEEPARIDSVENGLVLSSSQNLARVDHSGNVRYSTYYKAPEASLLAQIASTALIVGANVALDAVTSSGGFSPSYLDNPLLTERYRASLRAKDYHYLVTSEPDSSGHEGPSLVRIDKSNGKEAGRIWLKDKTPNYRVDSVTGNVFLLSGSQEIVAYRYD